MDEDHDPLRRRVLAGLLAGVPAGLAGSAFAATPPGRARREPGGNTWFCLRQDGAPQQAGWIAGAPPECLRGLVGAHADEVLEVCVAHDFRDVAPARFRRVFQPRLRGVIGMEIEFRGEVLRLAPTRMVAANLGFKRALERLLERHGAGRAAFDAEPRWAKLGAAALAGLAILDNDAADEFAGELALLAAGVDSLADDDERGFRTFFYPASRDGQNWNFYSGEALLFWAEARRRGLPFAPSAERCRSVFERCRDTHRRNRNPAFVPWHTQACASLFAQTGDRAYAAFVLEMNDWLLPMQQWDGVAPDLRGRFYDPQRPEFGPPHASSTAVYLEGLTDAAPVARALGESRRAERYERAVRRGLRALRQLQYRDSRDMFYISRPERVRGALRAKAYDNAVRVDSAGHALAAAVKILRPMQFGTG